MIFDAFNGIYRNIDARLKAEQFRRQIANVLAIWENWIVFPQTYIDSLADILTRKETAPQTKEPLSSLSNASAALGSGSGSVSATSIPTSSPSTGKSGFTNTFQVLNESKDDDDIDGVPMEDQDLDGVPLKDNEDLDGVPMEQDDIDGVPMDDEDLDGVPM